MVAPASPGGPEGNGVEPSLHALEVLDPQALGAVRNPHGVAPGRPHALLPGR